MTTSSPVKLELLVTKILNSDNSAVYGHKKADQILWLLWKLKKDYKIESFIPISVVVAILVDGLSISINEKTVKNALAPIRGKIHRKDVEGEIAYKIMQEGIDHVQKVFDEKESSIALRTHSKEKYRRESVVHAIDRVKLMEKEKVLKPGLYYVVLIDLVGSTMASTQLSPDENKKRIKQFIQFTKEALPSKGRNTAIFVKDIGDAALFLFSNFQDILDWSDKTDKSCDQYNKLCIERHKPELYQMYSKKCIHLGEVHFNEQSDPIALVINQIAKIEKKFKKDELGITDAVKQVILPRINSQEIKAKKIKNIVLHGERVSRPLWTIAY
ncbi:MAG: hypothetical protein HMLIMOIP_001711 [Candidatus Nitrosomirales archaeon]|jgi:hypothetical protein